MPNIVIDVAGEAAGSPGVARDFIYSKISPTPPLVTLSIDDNTGITTWAWEILAQPTGASATLGTPTASTTTFTPTAAIPGTYLIRVTLNGTIVLTNAVAWRTQNENYRYPAPGEKTEFSSTRGWEPDVNAIHVAIENGTTNERQRKVIDYVTSTSVPPTEVLGDRYILDDSGAPHANWDGASQLDLVQFNGVSWVAYTPREGWLAYVDLQDKDALYADDGTPSWTLKPVNHNRSHAMTSTSDHTAGNWKSFGSNGSGNITETAHGATGTLWTSTGASSAPSWQSPPTIDDTYNNFGATASTITIDGAEGQGADLTWVMSADNAEFKIDLTTGGASHGNPRFCVANGTDNFDIFKSGANQLRIAAALNAVDVNASDSIDMSAGSDAAYVATNALSFQAHGGSLTEFNSTSNSDLDTRFADATIIGAINETYFNDIVKSGTGIYYGGEITINGGDNTKVDVAAGLGFIVDSYTDPENTTVTKVTWSDKIGVAVTNIATQLVTVFHIDSGGNLIQGAAQATQEQLRDRIELGLALHTDLASVSLTQSAVEWLQDPLKLRDLIFAMGVSLNISGNDYSANGTDLKVSKSAGSVFGPGTSYKDDKQNSNIQTTSSSAAPSMFVFYRGTPTNVSVSQDVPNNFYDPNGDGTLVAVPDGWFTVHRLYYNPPGDLTILQYGQYIYDSLKKAIDAADKEVFVRVPEITGAPARTLLAVQKGTTDLSDRTKAKFRNLGVYGDRNFESIQTFSQFAESVEIIDALSYQQQDITLLVDTGVIYLDTEAIGGGDITYIFGQQEYDLDCTTGSGVGGKARVALTAGTATNPQKNWIYTTRNGDVAQLQAATSEPTGEHAMLGTAVLPDVSTFTSRGAYGSRRWTQAKEVDGVGINATILRKLRDLAVGYLSGLTPVLSINAVPDPDEVDFTVSSGDVREVYDQTTDALQLSVDNALVVNDETTSYVVIDDLNDITTDSTGATLQANNTYYQLVVAISTNTSGDTQLLINKPSGSYTTAQEAFNDVNGYSSTTFPSEFETIVLVCAFVLRYQTLSGGTYTNAASAFGVDFIDLRGQVPGSASQGSGAAAVTEFSDGAFKVFNAADATKELAFDVSGVTTATTRTVTIPDANGTMILSGSSPSFVNTTLSGNLTLTSGGTIDTTANGNITLDPNGTGYNIFGAKAAITDGGASSGFVANSLSMGHNTADDKSWIQSSGVAASTLEINPQGGLTVIGGTGVGSHGLGTGDVVFNNDIEVEETIYANKGVVVDVNRSITFGTGTATLMQQSNIGDDRTVLGLRDSERVFVICDRGDFSFDHGHGAATNPLLAIHSANASTSEYIGIQHDQTDAQIIVGKGNLGVDTNVDVDGHVVTDGIVFEVTNKSGGSLAVGDLVVWDTGNNNAVTTSTTDYDVDHAGIVVVGGAADATIKVAKMAHNITVNYTGTAPARGDYLSQSTTVKLAKGGDTVPASGIFGIALEAGSGGSVKASTWPVETF